MSKKYCAIKTKLSDVAVTVSEFIPKEDDEGTVFVTSTDKSTVFVREDVVDEVKELIGKANILSESPANIHFAHLKFFLLREQGRGYKSLFKKHIDRLLRASDKKKAVKAFLKSYNKDVNIHLQSSLNEAKRLKDAALINFLRKVKEIHSKYNSLYAPDVIRRDMEVLQFAIKEMKAGRINATFLKHIDIASRLEFLQFVLADSYSDLEDKENNERKTILENHFEKAEYRNKTFSIFQNLKEQLKKSYIEFIKNILSGTEIFRENKALATTLKEAFETMLEDPNWFEKSFLGLGSDPNLILQAFDIYKHTQKFNIAGSFTHIFDVFVDSWKKVKHRYKELKKLLDKNEKGLTIPKLNDIHKIDTSAINYYFNKIIKAIYESDEARVKAFIGDFLDFLDKEGLEYLDYRKLPEIRDFVLNELGLIEYTGAFQADEEYVNQIKDIYGEAGYNFLIERAKTLLANYYLENNAVSATNISASDNPLRFLASIYGETDEDMDIAAFESMGKFNILITTDKEKVNNDVLELISDEDIAQFYTTAYTLLSDFINPVFGSEHLTFSAKPEITLALGLKYGGLSQTLKRLFHRFFLRKIKERKFVNAVNTSNYSEFFWPELQKTLDMLENLGIDISEVYNASDTLVDDNLFEMIKDNLFLAANLLLKRRLANAESVIEEVLKDLSLYGAADKFNIWKKRNIYGEKRPMKGKFLPFLDATRKFPKKLAPKSEVKLFVEGVLKRFKTQIEEALKRGEVITVDMQKGLYLGYDNNTGKYVVNSNGVNLRTFSKFSEVVNYLSSHVTDDLDGQGWNFDSLFLFVLKMYISKRLGLNPFSGFSNRFIGHFHTRAVAISGRYGFNEEHLDKARSFLAFANSLKYLAKLPGIGKVVKSSEKWKKLDTFKKFTEVFDLFQNKADELAEQGKIKSSLRGELASKFFDFSINNPEFKNQGEPILAIMANTRIEVNPEYRDKYGDTYPLFDGEDFVWEPGTLRLKPQFRTPKNILLWEQFRTDFYSLTDNIRFYLKVKSAVHATQGNYDPDDVPLVYGHMLGTATMIFARYLPETFNVLYGRSRIDARSGQQQGRKDSLYSHLPVTLAYLATKLGAVALAQGAFYYVLGAYYAATTAASIVGGVTWAVAGAYIIHKIYTTMHKEGTSIRANLEGVREAALFLADAALRSAEAPVRYFTFDRVKPLHKVEKKIEEKISDKVLLENVNNLAMESLAVLTQMLGYFLAIQAFLMFFHKDLDCEGDDKPCFDKKDILESKRKKLLQTLEDKIGMLGFRIKLLREEMGSYDSPLGVIADRINPKRSGAGNLIEGVVGTAKSIYELVTRSGDDLKAVLDLLQKSPFVPVPTATVRPFLNRGSYSRGMDYVDLGLKKAFLWNKVPYWVINDRQKNMIKNYYKKEIANSVANPINKVLEWEEITDLQYSNKLKSFYVKKLLSSTDNLLKQTHVFWDDVDEYYHSALESVDYIPPEFVKLDEKLNRLNVNVKDFSPHVGNVFNPKETGKVYDTFILLTLEKNKYEEGGDKKSAEKIERDLRRLSDVISKAAKKGLDYLDKANE